MPEYMTLFSMPRSSSVFAASGNGHSRFEAKTRRTSLSNANKKGRWPTLPHPLQTFTTFIMYTHGQFRRNARCLLFMRGYLLQRHPTRSLRRSNSTERKNTASHTPLSKLNLMHAPIRRCDMQIVAVESEVVKNTHRR